jgi:outer membrane protein OmpA-like peptidoglycan-associated protein
MKKFACALILSLLLGLNVFSQGKDIGLKQYFSDAEFFLSEESYPDALHDFLEIYKRGYQDNANINYKIGICYLNIAGQKDKSIDYLVKACLSASSKYRESKLTETMAPIDAFLYLGNAYRVNNMLDKAYLAYKKYKEVLPAEEKTLQEYADKQVDACKIAKEFMQKPLDISFINLGHPINTSSDESRAVVSGDGSTLAYMHRLPFYDAVYISINKNGKWAEPTNITPQIMSDGDQFVSCISYDGKMLLLTKEDVFNSDIYVSHLVNQRWTKSEPMKSDINTKYWESHASMTEDGKSLYFSSNRRGGIGNMDIYVTNLDADGNWGPVKNLGQEINTEFNEESPFITEDGSTLYYSSQGFTNMGGYDVFVSHRLGDSAWSVPENMGYPISTTDDDLFYYPWNNGKEAFVSRIDSGGYGGTDIYKVEFKQTINEPVTEKIENKTAISPLVVQVENQSSKSQLDSTKKTEPIQETIKEETVPVKSVFLSPIFFDFNKSQLTEKGLQELDKLIALMKEFPGLKVELLGYADALGPDDYNLRLSEKRALEAFKYIVSKGIDGARVKAIGKGETDFLAPNSNSDGTDNPDGRKLNRRIEFEISGIKSDQLIIKRLDPIPKGNQVQIK